MSGCAVTIALLLATPEAAVGRASAPAAAIRRLDGSTIAPAEIDTTVLRLMKAAKVPGLGLAVFNGGKVVYEKAYGVRDVKTGRPLTIDSVTTAASLSKTAFGVLVLQLVSEGKIELDKPVAQTLPKPLPEYPDYKDLAGDERWKLITPRMLLSHTAGFPNLRRFTDDGKLRIHFAPGSRYAYSGEGIGLLQLLVEEVVKRPLGELMDERIFRPLGLARTSMTWQPAFESDFASGHDEGEEPLGPQRRKRADAIGSMQTSLHDFAAFWQALAQASTSTVKILSPKAKALMVAPQIAIHSRRQFPTLLNEPGDANRKIELSYGLGVGLYSTPLGKAYFKEGHTDGFQNYAVMFDNGIGLVLMTNSSNGERTFPELIETVLGNPYTPNEWEGYVRRP